MTTTVVRLAAEVAAGKQLPASLTIKTNRRYGASQGHHVAQNQHHPYAVTANSNTIINRPVRIRSVATSVIVAPISSVPTNAEDADEGEMETDDPEAEEPHAEEEEELEMEQEELEEEEQVAAANGLLAWSRAAASQHQQQQQAAQAVLMQG
ncbi:hypothetical protein KR074_000510 [Drosophila pseudoananassae]|nr:hypothetical protein KR074_000510 [Drosophila pseudoananassae]